MVAANSLMTSPKAVQKKVVDQDFEDSKKASKVLSLTAQKRLELAKFLGRSGRGVNCRIDVQILTLEDIKWAALELERLAKSLQKIAESPDQNDVLQVLSARHEFTKTKVQMKSFQITDKEK